MPRHRLLLHIGTHKTATSTLQLLMTQQRDALKAQGFCYARTDREPLPNRNRHAFFRRVLTQGGPPVHAMHRVMLEEFEASGCDTLVLSDEGLADFPPHKDLGSLSVFARDFDIEVICYLRRQDFFVESFWNQRCKIGKQTQSIARFVEDPDVIRYMTYKDILDRWSTYGKVTAIGFEAAREIGIVESFAAATGMALPAAGKTRNISPSMTLAAALVVMNRAGDKTCDWQKLEPLLGPNLSRYALGSRLRTELLARFGDHNARLFEAYGVRFPATMPEEGREPLPDPSPEVMDRLRADYDGLVLAGEMELQNADKNGQGRRNARKGVRRANTFIAVPDSAVTDCLPVAATSAASRRAARRAAKAGGGSKSLNRGKR